MRFWLSCGVWRIVDTVTSGDLPSGWDLSNVWSVAIGLSDFTYILASTPPRINTIHYYGSVSGPIWSAFGGMGYDAQPSPKEEQKEQKTEEQERAEILEWDAVRKCKNMGMRNHITAWGALKKLIKHPAHHAKLLAMGYSEFLSQWRDIAIRLYQIVSELCRNLVVFLVVFARPRGR